MSRSVFILLICVGLIGSNGLILSPVLADIAREFDTTPTVVGRAIASFGAGTAVTALWLGRLIDGFGSARALKYAMVIGGCGQILAAFSGNWIQLTLAEALTGAASGVALPAIYGLTAEVSPRGQEAKTMGLVLFGWSVSLVLAVPAGALLADLAGWRMMLGLIGGLCVATFVFTRTISGSRAAPTDAKPIGRLQPLFLPGGWQAYLVCAFFMSSFYGCFAYSGAHVVQSFGQSATGAGLIALCYGLGFGALSFFARLIDNLGPLKIRRFGLLVAACILLVLGFSSSFPLFLAAVAVWGAVNNLLLNTIVTGLTALAPHSKGAVLGLYSSVTYLAAAVGTFVMGLLFSNYGFYAIGILAATLHILAALLLVVSKSAPNQKTVP